MEEHQGRIKTEYQRSICVSKIKSHVPVPVYHSLLTQVIQPVAMKGVIAVATAAQPTAVAPVVVAAVLQMMT